MDALEMDLLAREVDALGAELAEERFRSVAGIEPEPALARLFSARSRAAHRETVAALRAAGREELALRVGALRAERAQAEHEEAWRAAEFAATGRGPDAPLPLPALEEAVLRERDRERRLAFSKAAADAAEAAAGPREAAVEVRARARAEVGLFPDWKAVVAGDELLTASDDAFRDVLAFTVRRETGLAPLPAGDLTRADLRFALALRRWGGLFRAGMLPVALKLASQPLGLELGRIRIDDAARPGKWSGVHVLGPRVSYRPRGGASDWIDLLRGVGTAIAAAAVVPRRVEPSFAAAMGWVLSSLLLEPRFLAERADVERRHARDVVRDLALRELARLRARAAALRVATEVERGLSGAAWREAHREALTAALGAVWDGASAARDAEADAIAAALAGAAAGERLRETLRERFDEDWWRNPRTAAHLAGLLAAGRSSEDETTPEHAARALVARLEGA